MSYTLINFPLVNLPNYKFEASIEGNSYTVTITYNQKAKMSYLSLFDEEKNPIVTGVGLVPNYPMLLDYKLQNLTGDLAMQPKGDASVEYYKLYPENISEYYTLHYYHA